jgi:hypothetical protein
LGSASWHWQDVRDLFEVDDGSLPQIRITYKDKWAAAMAYALLRKRAARIASRAAYFWSNERGEEVPLDAVPNAAKLVVTGEAGPFHVVLSGIESQGAVIPDLGVFVFSDQLVLDYRMGPQWSEREVLGLFELLLALASLDPNAVVLLKDYGQREVRNNFSKAWQHWRAERGAAQRAANADADAADPSC